LHASEAVGAVNVGVVVQSIVVLPPADPIVGGVLSRTVTVCETVPLWFPHASTAFHMRVSVYAPAQAPGVVTSLTSCTVAVLHPSVAVGAVNVGVAGQLIVAFAPALLIVGAVLSITVKLCVHVLVQLFSVTVSVSVKVLLHKLPASTVTVEPVVDPEMVPLPVMLQL
jgi:hypothetical protein